MSKYRTIFWIKCDVLIVSWVDTKERILRRIESSKVLIQSCEIGESLGRFLNITGHLLLSSSSSKMVFLSKLEV